MIGFCGIGKTGEADADYGLYPNGAIIHTGYPRGYFSIGSRLAGAVCTLLLSTTKGNIDLLSELPADSPVFFENGGTNRRLLSDKSGRGHLQCLYIRSLGTNRRKRWIESGRYKRVMWQVGIFFSFHYQRLSIVSICQRTPC